MKMVAVNVYFKPEYKYYDHQTLRETATEIEMKMSDEDAKFVESITRDQHQNWIWEKLRVGRVTSSTFKNICRGKLQKPSHSLLMKLCYPEVVRFVSAKTEYGKINENAARNALIKEMQSMHDNFSCMTSGLVIDYKNPFFAASPDGICTCDCCRQYLQENYRKSQMFVNEVLVPEVMNSYYTKTY